MPRDARVPQPREWLLTKVCRRCGERKPWARFSPRGYNEDGSVRNVTTYCHSCQSATVADRQKEWRQRTIDRRRAYWREQERRRRLRAGSEPTIPAAPFREWLELRLVSAGGPAAVAAVSGVDARTLRRIRAGQAGVRLSVVDRCCVALGCHLSEVYPDLDELVGGLPGRSGGLS